jgi:hypothetical protein
MLFENGILNLTNWLGNVILPTLSGLFFAIAILRFAGSGQHQNWIYAGFLCLMASGILRALESFATQQAWNDPDLYWMSLVNLVNWTCNVAMPLYGVLQIVVGVLHFAGIGHRIYHASGWNIGAKYRRGTAGWSEIERLDGGTGYLQPLI